MVSPELPSPSPHPRRGVVSELEQSPPRHLWLYSARRGRGGEGDEWHAGGQEVVVGVVGVDRSGR